MGISWGLFLGSILFFQNWLKVFIDIHGPKTIELLITSLVKNFFYRSYQNHRSITIEVVILRYLTASFVLSIIIYRNQNYSGFMCNICLLLDADNPIKLIAVAQHDILSTHLYSLDS